LDDLADRQVVEQDDLRASLHRFGDLVQRTAFDLDFEPVWRTGAGGRDGRGNPAGGCDVIVLDENAVVEPQAVIEAAADTHGVLLQDPQPRGRLARVGD